LLNDLKTLIFISILIIDTDAQADICSVEEYQNEPVHRIAVGKTEDGLINLYFCFGRSGQKREDCEKPINKVGPIDQLPRRLDQVAIQWKIDEQAAATANQIGLTDGLAVLGGAGIGYYFTRSKSLSSLFALGSEITMRVVNKLTGDGSQVESVIKDGKVDPNFWLEPGQCFYFGQGKVLSIYQELQSILNLQYKEEVSDKLFTKSIPPTLPKKLGPNEIPQDEIQGPPLLDKLKRLKTR
jgi:hypothetical protein